MRGWWGRLLLFAALLLGIVTMHTLGHPSGHDAPPPAVQTVHTEHAVHTPHPPQAHHPDTAPPDHRRPALDPLSVCLAVLLGAGWTLVLPAALRRWRRGPAGAAARARARFAYALWPIPPPPRHKVLARLSVLRV
ncbi:DUF6153 family protein [Streptomyces caatingaensis]|uniref:Uncharacterized protein n=1 Tax=Streptomyces caatingaensis TaxID=1678637 RepID=A0A0K9XHH3_9ACTN|nr:DUF6153 family protein [Streptomyces caatingaensis]KNB52835.1 hypothetical protein AC230_09365 [Streptomyces caatingaensis]